MFKLSSVTAIPVTHSMTRGSSDRHQTHADGKERALSWFPEEKSTEPSILAVVNIELFRLEKAF